MGIRNMFDNFLRRFPVITIILSIVSCIGLFFVMVIVTVEFPNAKILHTFVELIFLVWTCFIVLKIAFYLIRNR